MIKLLTISLILNTTASSYSMESLTPVEQSALDALYHLETPVIHTNVLQMIPSVLQLKKHTLINHFNRAITTAKKRNLVKNEPLKNYSHAHPLIISLKINNETVFKKALNKKRTSDV